MFLCFYYQSDRLRAVAKNRRAVRHKQEVDSDTHNDEISVGHQAANLSAGVAEVELTSTRDVDVTRGLVRARVQVPGDHVHTDVIRSVDVSAAEHVRDVGVEELSREVAVQRDTVSLNVDQAHGVLRVDVGGLALGRGNSRIELNRRGSGRGREDRSRRGAKAHRLKAVSTKRDVELVNSENRTGNDTNVAKSRQSCREVDSKAGVSTEVSRVLGRSDTRTSRESRIPVPAILQAAEADRSLLEVGVLIPSVEHGGAGHIGVDAGAKTNVQGLNGPLHLLEEDVVGVLVDALGLVAVDADKGEADALDEDVVTIVPT